MNEFIEKTVQMMRMKGVNTLLVKGQGGAQCYARPLWRSSGDVDFFLDAENFEKAKRVLPLWLRMLRWRIREGYIWL